METRGLVWVLGLMGVVSLSSLQGCNDDAATGDTSTGGTTRASGGTAGSDADGTSGGSGGATQKELWCDTYCGDYFKHCENHAANTYDSEEDCRSTCKESSWPLGTDEFQGGSNSVGCRKNHAALANDDAHCEHAAEVATGPCE